MWIFIGTQRVNTAVANLGAFHQKPDEARYYSVLLKARLTPQLRLEFLNQ